MLESANQRTIATAEEKRNYHGGSIDSTVATISRENELGSIWIGKKVWGRNETLEAQGKI